MLWCFKSVLPTKCPCPHINCHSGILKLHVLYFPYSVPWQCSSFFLCCPSLISQYLLPNFNHYLNAQLRYIFLFRSFQKCLDAKTNVPASIVCVYEFICITHIYYTHVPTSFLYRLRLKILWSTLLAYLLIVLWNSRHI